MNVQYNARPMGYQMSRFGFPKTPFLTTLYETPFSPVLFREEMQGVVNYAEYALSSTPIRFVGSERSKPLVMIAAR